MVIEARTNPAWAVKWAMISAALWGFAGWSLYDGLWGYPKHNRRVALYEQLRGENRLGQWPTIAAERGWSGDNPGAAKPHMELVWQWIFAGVCFPLAGLATGMVMLQRRRRLRAGPSDLQGPGGQKITYDQITQVDTADWQRKGIARIHYTDAAGAPAVLKVDEWVYRGAGQVLRAVQQHTGRGEAVAG